MLVEQKIDIIINLFYYFSNHIKLYYIDGNVSLSFSLF